MKLKKLGLVTIIASLTLSLVGCINREIGDLLYNGRFEIVDIIDSNDCIYEVRDTKEGVHYFMGTYYDTFSPVIKNNGEIKITEKNHKYTDKSSSVSKKEKKEVE